MDSAIKVLLVEDDLIDQKAFNRLIEENRALLDEIESLTNQIEIVEQECEAVKEEAET